MKLYYAHGTISLAVAIALEEAGVDYEAQRLDFSKAEQAQPKYLSINPKGRVPALEVGDEILTEAGAILDYIGAIAPAAGLVPDSPVDAAHMRAVMYYLASTMHVNHAHKMRGHRWANREESWTDMTAKVPETMTASAQFVEDHCLKLPYVLGTRFSLADPYLFIVCSWLEGDKVDLEPFPKIRAFLAEMEDRASIRGLRERDILR